MNFRKKRILLVLMCAALMSGSCSKSNEVLVDDEVPTNPLGTKPIVGFNQNWSFMPAFSEVMLKNIAQLKPQMVRYPGGTITHSWDWERGVKIGNNNADVHPLTDIKRVVDATGCRMIIVLDILNRTYDDQLRMLKSIQNLGIPITHIELGNELYAQDEPYVATFPTGKEYGAKAAEWATKLKKDFPNVKVSALLQCRSSEASNQRLAQWNGLVVSTTYTAVDAYTYHIYIPVGGWCKSRSAEFAAVAKQANTKEKELWITEYGNQNDKTSTGYLKSLDSLATFVETYPRVAIALNHLIVGNDKNKLVPDGSTFTPEGQLFLDRALKR